MLSPRLLGLTPEDLRAFPSLGNPNMSSTLDPRGSFDGTSSSLPTALSADGCSNSGSGLNSSFADLDLHLEPFSGSAASGAGLSPLWTAQHRTFGGVGVGETPYASAMTAEHQQFPSWNPSATSDSSSASSTVKKLASLHSNGAVKKTPATASLKRPRAQARQWSKAEDELLRKGVEAHGGRNWKAISSYVPNRSSVQCLQRWKKALDPAIVKGPWSQEEDRRLLAKMEEKGKTKSNKAVVIKGRTEKQCRERFNCIKTKLSDW